VPQRRERKTREVRLFALQPKGIARVARQDGEIEFRLFAGLVHADLPGRRPFAHRDEILRQPEFVEHLQRRRVEGRGTQIRGQFLGLLVKHHRHPVACQS
jgi:hypothetical protein